MFGMKFPWLVNNKIDKTTKGGNIKIRTSSERFYFEPICIQIIGVKPKVGRGLTLIMDVSNAFTCHPFIKPFFKDIADYVILFNYYLIVF